MNPVRSELARKGVHIAMGAFALLLRWLTPLEAAACAALALVFNLFLLHRLTGRALLREEERSRGFSLGITLYPAAVLVLVLVFRTRLELAAAVWALIAFGDGMASVAGTTLGGRKLPWNPRKSWAGFVAFVLWGTATSAFLVRWVQRGALDAAGDGHVVTWIGSSFLDAGSSDGGFVWLVSACAGAAVVAAFAESLRTPIDDNILVPLVGGIVLWTATFVVPSRLAAAETTISKDFLIGAIVNAILAGAALLTRGVGRSGAIAGWILGTALFALSGWRGFAMLAAFFVLGTACTKLGWSRKVALGIAQEEGGRRGAKHAIANAIAGVCFAFLAVATPYEAAFMMAMVAAFATAASDTVASEIGQAFGRTHVLVTTLRRVPPGTDGAVSLEGTLAGIAASVIVAGVAWGTGVIRLPGLLVVIGAAFFGTTLESYLGAILGRDGAIDNEVVNFVNTLAGGLFALTATLLLF